MMSLVKRFVPRWALDAYHRALSFIAASWYGHPSERLLVIGVTGTNGKTTTSYLIARALEAVGDRSGCATTAVFKIGDREWLNETKMTMLGRFALQRLLAQMVAAGCRYAVVETSSQGVVQHRHRAINYDIAVFTNLTPEHIEAHGSFEAYQRAKVSFFEHVARSRRKILQGVRIPKIAIVNRDDAHARAFEVAGFDRLIHYGIGRGDGVSATDLHPELWGTSFTIEGHRSEIHIPGDVNVANATAAIAVATSIGFPLIDAMSALGRIGGVPGRFERIDEGQPFLVIVDYAVEPVAMGKLYETVQRIPHERIIHVLGSCGGGRDVARRPVLGRIAGEQAQLVIVTTEDPYDDDPRAIMEDVARGARAVVHSAERVVMIEDRAEAIRRAIAEARAGDIVLLTGKGCEQAIMLAHGRRMPWDEREIARAALRAR